MPLRRVAGSMGFLFLVAGVITLVYALLGPAVPANTPSRPTGSDDSTLTGFSRPIEAPVVPGGEESLSGQPSEAPLARLRAARVDIDAPIVILGTAADGVMQSPDKPDVVAWYDFTSRPGFGGNAVFAGHLDFANYGPAVFWRLRELRLDDEIVIGLEDGTSYRYTVVESRTFDAVSAPVQDIVGPTEGEMVTLITCAGKFDRRTRQYDQRLVVRAIRS